MKPGKKVKRSEYKIKKQTFKEKYVMKFCFLHRKQIHQNIFLSQSNCKFSTPFIVSHLVMDCMFCLELRENSHSLLTF